MFLPYPIRAGIAFVKSWKYMWKGAKTLAKGKMEVPVLDATAIGVSVLRGDFDTAGSVMFLLGIGEILEEWTHKKSVGDLARSMSLNIEKVWLLSDEPGGSGGFCFHSGKRSGCASIWEMWYHLMERWKQARVW